MQALRADYTRAGPKTAGRFFRNGLSRASIADSAATLALSGVSGAAFPGFQIESSTPGHGGLAVGRGVFKLSGPRVEQTNVK